MPPVTITGLDHLVLTVADVDQSIAFYQRVLGMQPVGFGQGRRALTFGPSKINLHQAGHELTPHAARPAPGTADLCLVTSTPLDAVVAHLAASGVAVEEGPVPRTGAQGPMTSVYIRDPDHNSDRDRQLPGLAQGTRNPVGSYAYRRVSIRRQPEGVDGRAAAAGRRHRAPGRQPGGPGLREHRVRFLPGHRPRLAGR